MPLMSQNVVIPLLVINDERRHYEEIRESKELVWGENELQQAYVQPPAPHASIVFG